MAINNLYWQETLLWLDSLTVYRSILRDNVIKSFRRLCRAMASDTEVKDVTARYYAFLSTLLINADRLGLKGNIFRKYVIHLFLNNENIFTLACERNELVENATLYQLAERDLRTLRHLCGLDIQSLCGKVGSGEDLTKYKPVLDTEDPYLEEVENANTPTAVLKALIWRYKRMGAGDMASFGMFKVSTDSRASSRYRLTGIPRADEVTFNEIVGCRTQKEALIKNTEDFLSGLPANNMLLAGSRGNGKSSCVKALINAYAEKGLRLIELRKDQSHILPDLMNGLTVRGKYFIVFMDDLSYEHFETQYKYLKSILEGGAEARPKNVLFYATSNRRHIIQENWVDRAEQPTEGEVHTTDTVNEKLSLFDRFGITILFPNLGQPEYLTIVNELASRRKLVIDSVFLAEQAVRWSLTQKSMSGRTARQFIDHIEGEMARL